VVVTVVVVTFVPSDLDAVLTVVWVLGSGNRSVDGIEGGVLGGVWTTAGAGRTVRPPPMMIASLTGS
jgi:hypothetical protein